MTHRNGETPALSLDSAGRCNLSKSFLEDFHDFVPLGL